MPIRREGEPDVRRRRLGLHRGGLHAGIIRTMGPRGERSLIHRGSKFDFEQVSVRMPSGRTVRREVVRHPGAVLIVPILSDGRIVLIRNFRVALEDWLWELPAGTLGRDEPPRDCAARELIEETGYRAARIEPIADYLTSPGLGDEIMHAFLATGLVHIGQDLEDDESIEVRPVPPSEALAMIDRGDLRDAKSMLALLLAERRGLLRPARDSR